MKNPPLSYCIARSHPYWGRKPSSELQKIFNRMKPGDVLLDPFCGEAAPVAAALQSGAKVLAGAVNPLDAFLSKVLMQPVGLYALKKAFDEVQNNVAGSIQKRYTCKCPGCRKTVPYEYLEWGKAGKKDRPESVRVTCKACGFNQLNRLSRFQSQKQLSESKVQPGHWFPEKKIQVSGEKDVLLIQELFTQRTLKSLAELLNAINKISSERCRETLQFVFTGILKSCITIQNRNSGSRASDRLLKKSGFASPSSVAEKNVWKAFEKQYTAVLTCKKELNALFGCSGLSSSMDEFVNTDNQAYFHTADLLSSPFPRKLNITHIFIDPPYNRSIRREALSALCGTWLKMNFTDKSKRHSGLLPDEEYIQKLPRFLLRMRKKTAPSCRIVLADRTQNTELRESLRSAFSKIGYETKTLGPEFFDTAEKPGQKRGRVTDRYYSIAPMAPPAKKVSKKFSKRDCRELQLCIQVAAFRKGPDKPEKVKRHTGDLIRPSLQPLLAERTVQEIRETISDKAENRRAYNRMCLSLIRAILLKDGYHVKSVADGSFCETYPDIDKNTADFKIHDRKHENIDFIAENREGKKIFFCFYSPEKEKALKQTAEEVFQKDKREFQVVLYLVFPDKTTMRSYRHVSQADKWPRGFCVCLEDIYKKAAETAPNRWGHLISMEPAEPVLKNKNKRRIKHFKAAVIKNTPVGLDGNPMHFKLQFTAPDLHNIGPGQFVMVDTLPEHQRQKRNRPAVKPTSESNKHKMDLAAKSFLKRPFGVQRAYYKHFKWGYHNKLHLPAQLAAITNTVYPHKFELFYKIIEDGTGTNELKKLRPGNQIKILGPLGKFTNIPKWRSDNIDEVHLIGGGVGMAPLVFFGQALKFYAFKLKAFIGIDRIVSLQEAPYGKTFADESGKAYVYIDELSNIGLNPDEIFLSRESTDKEILSDKISMKNYHVGLVVDHYNLYLSRLKQKKSIMILACGPKPMLVALKRAASKFNIPMKVLLEKRMGCGIGVCMSCVCRTRKGSTTSRYSRVCVEGPLFDATEIDWEKL